MAGAIPAGDHRSIAAVGSMPQRSPQTPLKDEGPEAFRVVQSVGSRAAVEYRAISDTSSSARRSGQVHHSGRRVSRWDPETTHLPYSDQNRTKKELFFAPPVAGKSTCSDM